MMYAHAFKIKIKIVYLRHQKYVPDLSINKDIDLKSGERVYNIIFVFLTESIFFCEHLRVDQKLILDPVLGVERVEIKLVYIVI